jgi:hypothetical protein
LEMGSREHGGNDFPDGLFIVHHEDAIKGHGYDCRVSVSPILA